MFQCVKKHNYVFGMCVLFYYYYKMSKKWAPLWELKKEALYVV